MNPMLALGRAIQRRGHRVTYIGFADAEERFRVSDMGFHMIGADGWPLGETPKFMNKLGEMSGWKALRYTEELGTRQIELILRDAPAALRAEGVDGVLIDQAIPGTESVVQHLGLPYVSVANILLLNLAPDVPPPIMPWVYKTSLIAKARYRFAYGISAAYFGVLPSGMFRAINKRRREWGLPPFRHPLKQEYLSELAQVAQIPKEMDFPRKGLPPTFHYCGAWTDAEERAPVEFPWDRLDGRPMVYCALGTVQNRLQWMFEAITRECEGLDVQLVISLGGGASAEEYEDRNMPGDPLIVGFAPQLELLKKAALCICHGGLNSTLEAVQMDVPVVPVPITNDQPGVAARVVYCGMGEMVLPSRLKKVGFLRDVVSRVIREPEYKQNVIRIHEAIKAAGGADRAAEIAIEALTTGKPVYA
jgi:zeaxanthin glucosyltransferase